MNNGPDNNILIIGGGLGGLLLANGLELHGYKLIGAQVFERDETALTRSQGYIIGLNPNGIQAIKDSVSGDKFQRIENLLKPSQFVVADRNLNILLNFASGMTINRAELRDILMEGIDIKFGKRLATYVETDGIVIATFEDGTEAEGVVLVGADGVNSVVRQKKIPDFKFADTNVYKIQALVPCADQEILKSIFPNENSVVIKTIGNDKNTVIFGRTKSMKEAVGLGLEGDENTYALETGEYENCEMILINYEWRPEPNTELPNGKQEMLECIRQGTAKFHPAVVKLVNELAKPQHINQTRPVGLTQADHFAPFPTTRVTMIGDSVHPMTSHAGLGANTAMKSASELAVELCNIFNRNEPLTETLAAFEKKMVIRGFQAIDVSRSSTERMHARSVGLIGEMFRNTMMRFFVKLIEWGIVKLPT